MLSTLLDRDHLISLNFCTDRSLLDIQKKLQYADDFALVADSAKNLNLTMLGLKINIQKTEFIEYISEPQDRSPTLSI